MSHVTHHSNGAISYKHLLIAPALVRAGRKDVVLLPPEFIRSSDGHTKAENELTAAKRCLQRMGERLSPMSVMIMADDLYTVQPCLRLVREWEMNYRCVCKPQSHRYLQQCIDSHRRCGELETRTTTERTGKERRGTVYEWIEDVPIRSPADTMHVRWVGVRVCGEDGRTIYRNSLITHHRVHAEPVADIAAAGRARWRVENENINTLKTKGYNLEIISGSACFRPRKRVPVRNTGDVEHPGVSVSHATRPQRSALPSAENNTRTAHPLLSGTR